MAAAAIFKNQKIATSRPRFEVKLKREVELLHYGSVLFHSAGTGFVRYYISLKFSRKTENIKCKKLPFHNNV